jgi:hypothetical protein
VSNSTKQGWMELAGDDWMEIDERSFLIPRTSSHAAAGRGSVLWDSRVAHCSYPVLGAALTTRPVQVHTAFALG